MRKVNEMAKHTNYEIGVALNTILTADMEQLLELELEYKGKLGTPERDDASSVERVLQVIAALMKW